MPGVIDAPGSKFWFDDAFGFKEKLDFEETRSMFEIDGDGLTSKGNGRKFHLGPFELVSVGDLRVKTEAASLDSSDGFMMAGDLKFDNLISDTNALYEDEDSSGAVFQVCSLFNCLETVIATGARPEDGVARYGGIPFQGAASATSCPAALAFRNYLVNGVGQTPDDRQLDCLREVGNLVGNEKENYWTMRQGYCTPVYPGSIKKLSNQISSDKHLADQVRQKFLVGVHWDTDIWTGKQRVCQVFCSALPVAHFKTAATASDWQGFGQAVLDAAFEATLAVAVSLAQARGARVKVFLTALGGGELGNRRNWIADAIDKALTAYRMYPLDVFLVHNAEVPEVYRKLEDGRKEKITRMTRRSATTHALRLAESRDEVRRVSEVPAATTNKTLDKLSRMFAVYDANGDGVMSLREFEDMLVHANESFFTLDNIRRLIQDADSDGDGCIHYEEFLQFVFREEDLSDVLVNAAGRSVLQQTMKATRNMPV